jgi:hypothetical protein
LLPKRHARLPPSLLNWIQFTSSESSYCLLLTKRNRDVSKTRSAVHKKEDAVSLATWWSHPVFFPAILLTLWTNFQSFHSLTHPECGATCHIDQYFRSMQPWTTVAVNVVRCRVVAMLPPAGTAPSVQCRDFCVPSYQTVSHWIGQERGRAETASIPTRSSERRHTVWVDQGLGLRWLHTPKCIRIQRLPTAVWRLPPESIIRPHRSERKCAWQKRCTEDAASRLRLRSSRSRVASPLRPQHVSRLRRRICRQEAFARMHKR